MFPCCFSSSPHHCCCHHCHLGCCGAVVLCSPLFTFLHLIQATLAIRGPPSMSPALPTPSTTSLCPGVCPAIMLAVLHPSAGWLCARRASPSRIPPSDQPLSSTSPPALSFLTAISPLPWCLLLPPSSPSFTLPHPIRNASRFQASVNDPLFPAISRCHRAGRPSPSRWLALSWPFLISRIPSE